MFGSIRILTTFLATAFVAGALCAQEGDLPPPPKGDPADVNQQAREARKREGDAALADLAAAWKASGRPSLIVLVGAPLSMIDEWTRHEVRVRASGAAPKQVTTMDDAPESPREPREVAAALAPLRYIGDNLTLDDPAGLLQRVSNHIRTRLGENGIANIVDPAATAEARARLMAAYAQAGEDELLASIAAEVGAEFVLYARLSSFQRESTEGQPPELRVAISLEIKVPTTGRSHAAGNLPDARLGVGNEFVSAYGDRMTHAFSRQLRSILDMRSGDGVQYILKVRGIDLNAAVKLAAAARAALPEALTTFDVKRTGGVRNEPVADIDAWFRGDAIGLYTALQPVFRESLGLDVWSPDMAPGRLTLVTAPAREQPTRRERWELLLQPGEAGGAQLRTLLQTCYMEKSRPKIGVIINQELSDLKREALTDAELQQYGLDPGVARVVRLIVPPGAGGLADGALDTATLQNHIIGEFTEFGLTVHDAAEAQAKCLQEADRTGKLMEDATLRQLLRSADGVDVLVRGLGKRIDANQPRFAFTFDVIETRTGHILAVASDSVLATEFVDGRDALTRLAERVSAKLADQLILKWHPPQTIEVTVYGAMSQDHVFAVMNMFKDDIDGVLRTGFRDFSAGDAAVGRFWIDYNGTYQSLIDQIRQKSDVLNFTIKTDTAHRSILSIQVKE